MSLELQRTVWLAGLCPGCELTEELSWALLLVWRQVKHLPCRVLHEQ